MTPSRFIRRATTSAFIGAIVVMAAAPLPAGAAAALPAQAIASAARAVAPASRGAARSWRVAQRLSVRHRDVLMVGIDALSARDAWVLGEVTSDDSLSPLVEHWTGRGWCPVALPPAVRRRFGQADEFDSLSVSSDRDLWAVTANGHYLRLLGTRWTAGVLPGTRSVLVESVKAFGPSDVWIFGARIFGAAGPHPKAVPYAARFDGRTWRRVPVSATGDIGVVSAISRSDMIAVTGLVATGLGEPVRPEVLRWDGRSWRPLASQPPLPRRAVMYAAYARSDRDVWIGGSVPDGPKRSAAVVEQWNGSAWVRATPTGAPSGQGFIVSLASDGRGGLWALGASFANGGRQVWQNTAGSWSAPTSLTRLGPTQLGSVPHTTATWAIGEVKVHGRYIGLIDAHGLLTR